MPVLAPVDLSSPIPHVALDRDRRIVAVNDAWCALLDASSEAVVGRRWLTFVHPPDAPLLSQALDTAGGDPPSPQRHRLRGPDGRSIPVTAYAKAHDTDGVGWILALIPTAEAPTSRGTDVLDLAEDMSVGHWKVDVASQTCAWSDEVYRIHGYAPGAFIPSVNDGISAYHPDDRPRVERAVAEASERGAGFAFEARIVRPDGEIRHVRSIGRAVAERGQVRWIVGVFQDITEHREARRALQVSEERYALAMAAAGVGLWDWDMVTGDLYWNDRLKEIIGITDPRFTPHLHELDSRLHPDDRERASTALSRHLSARDPYDLQYRLRHEDGSYRWIHAVGQACWDASGRPTRMVGSMIDRTSEVRALKELEARTAELARSNADLERFATIASHDLKEPLRRIQTFADRLVSTATLDGRSAAYLDRIRASAARLCGLVDDVLALSSLRDVAPAMPVAELASIALDVIADLDLDPHRITIAPLPRVAVAPAHARILLHNLLSNCAKYRSPKRDLAVAIEAGRTGNSRIQVTILDNGIGFAPRDEDRIFELFHRLHTREHSEGTGLGLALCKKVVTIYGGRITARGVPDEGAAFTFDLPIAEDA